jgi:mannosyl-3-phosphoglycerate phosphatase family protein
MRVVFTDLNGSLLKPQTNSYGAALPALKALQRRSIPLILVSSRTRAELESLQQQLQIAHPFVGEDGAAAFLPEQYFPKSILNSQWQHQAPYYVRVLGLPYDHLRQVLQDVRRELKTDIVGFGDWTEAELALAMGLSDVDARLAHQREYSEIFTFTGEPFLLEEAIERHHLQVRKLRDAVLQGQWYLTGNADKVAAVRDVMDCFDRHARPVRSLGLSNDPSDAGWLQTIEQVVVIPGTHSDALWEQHRDSWHLAQLPGPEGWNDAVLEWLEVTDDLEE